MIEHEQFTTTLDGFEAWLVDPDMNFMGCAGLWVVLGVVVGVLSRYDPPGWLLLPVLVPFVLAGIWTVRRSMGTRLKLSGRELRIEKQRWWTRVTRADVAEVHATVFIPEGNQGRKYAGPRLRLVVDGKETVLRGATWSRPHLEALATLIAEAKQVPVAASPAAPESLKALRGSPQRDAPPG